MNKLIIKGASEHNLKNIDLELEKNKLIVFTGISGSGKSSMAFDTIYTEGQRRYVESLSNYTKQFLGVMKKPKLDSIEGLSPAISIEQKTSSSNPRSTVGTVTEILDFIRMLYARIGVQHCHSCGREVSSQTVDEMIEDIDINLEDGEKFLIISPYIEKQKGNLKNDLEALKTNGYARVLIDDVEFLLEDDIKVDPKKFHNLFVVVDRLSYEKEDRSRLAESIETALNLANGNMIVRKYIAKTETTDFYYSEKNYCQHCKISFPDLSPNSFSFNTPAGMCPECHGLGFFKAVDVNKLITNPEKSVSSIPFLAGQNIEMDKVKALFEHHGVKTSTPFKRLPEKLQKELLYGTKLTLDVQYKSKTFNGTISMSFEGLVNIIERRFKETVSEAARNYYDKYMSDKHCPSCNGKRLRKESLSVKVYGETIDTIVGKQIDELLDFVAELDKKVSDKEKIIIGELKKELLERLSFLVSVGLSYLTLDRSARTLSGGESQRIRLASQIASGLTGVIYVLDEPSIGLHQKDNLRLLNNLLRLRDKGNTVLVVEHDRDTIEAADTIVDFGPEAGIYGGEIIYEGNLKNLYRTPSRTSDYVFRRKNIEISRSSKKVESHIVLENVSTNNLKKITAKFPMNQLTVVTGVSGAGKSSLVMDSLLPALKKIAKNSDEIETEDLVNKASYDSIYLEKNEEKIYDFNPRLIVIDQSPIGRTPRSNPVTYIGAFELIRDIMSETKLSKARGYNKSRFSFNVKGGRCEKCGGSGVIKIEMHFLADVYVECDVCKGMRYNSETLDIKFKDKNIHDILEMDVQEAYKFFENIPKLKNKLGTLMSVGLGYIKLGQASTTLSGGEAQRIKLAKELSRSRVEGTVYILDEPTTGLHFYDIQKLMSVLEELRDSGSTIIVIEHNLDVIVNADHLIDIGPDGGPSGGQLIYAGNVENIVKCKKSYTGDEVRKELEQRKKV
ncbi:MAG: excinuclease ABC subunit UvrA [Candidatus Delongbacteria bacterium]|nr:excinuclease ABC subunit UvrA [Candidatus Delongbacteria bacterium]MBN2835682.1 excinuclease ABC subunit UvrA [Candidatus Delongbacteria bacterium]